MPNSAPIWMTATERDEYSRRDKVKCAENEARVAAWLRGEPAPDEKYLILNTKTSPPRTHSLTLLGPNLQSRPRKQRMADRATIPSWPMLLDRPRKQSKRSSPSKMMILLTKNIILFSSMSIWTKITCSSNDYRLNRQVAGEGSYPIESIPIP